MIEIFSIFDEKSLGVCRDEDIPGKVEKLQTLLDVLTHSVQGVLLVWHEAIGATVRLHKRFKLLQTADRWQEVIKIFIHDLIH